MRKLILPSLLALTFLSCNDGSDAGMNNPDGTISLAPRIETQQGTPLPQVDSVRITVLNANSPTAAPYYERSIPWNAHGDTIRGIPTSAKIRVQISGLKNQTDGSRATWWSGASEATFSGTTTMDAQSFPVPVALGDTSAPSILSIHNDTIENTDSLMHLVWRLQENGRFDAVIGADTLHPSGDSIVLSRSWTTGDTLSFSIRFRDDAGNITTRSERLVRRPRVAAPVLSVTSGSFSDTTRTALTCSTAEAEIEWSPDSGRSWNRYLGSLLMGSNQSVWARASRKGWTTSPIVKAFYEIRAAAPTFSLPDGTDTFDLIALKLATATPEGTLEVSLDSGRTWAIYRDSLVLGRDIQIWSRTVKRGLDSSGIVKARYEIAVDAPKFSIASGTSSNDNITIRITTRTSGALIETTKDGSTWTPYSDSMVLGATTTMAARVTKSGMAPSASVWSSYTIQADPPVFSIWSGFSHHDLLTVNLTSTTPNPSFEVSLDSGKTWNPSARSVVIGKTVQVWARTAKSGMTPSAITKAIYNIQAAAPTFSLPDGTDTIDLITVRLASLVRNPGFEVSLDSGKTWNPYLDSLVLGKTVQVWARTVKEGLTTSAVAKAIYIIKAATPTFSLPNGTESSDFLTIKLASRVRNPVIEVSLDSGKTWNPYLDSLVLRKTVQVWARTVKTGLTTSAVGKALYNVAVAIPTVTLSAGIFESRRSLWLRSATPGAVIRYTLDGSTPTLQSALFTDSIRIDSSVVLKAVAFKDGMESSPLLVTDYELRAQQVTASYASDFTAFGVRFRCPTPNTTIRYTTDGSAPTESSPLATDSLVFTDTYDSLAFTVRAFSSEPGIQPSRTASYRIGPKLTRFTDTRDGKVYRKITIGQQTWMAQNLAYATGYGYGFYNNDSSRSSTDGMLYTWSAAMGLPAQCDNQICSTQVLTKKHKGACPAGWHVPTRDEWLTLLDEISSQHGHTGSALKPQPIWPSSQPTTNASGMSIRPSGSLESEPGFQGMGYAAYIWSASENDASTAYLFFLFDKPYDTGSLVTNTKTGRSLRCVVD